MWFFFFHFHTSEDHFRNDIKWYVITLSQNSPVGVSHEVFIHWANHPVAPLKTPLWYVWKIFNFNGRNILEKQFWKFWFSFNNIWFYSIKFNQNQLLYCSFSWILLSLPFICNMIFQNATWFNVLSSGSNSIKFNTFFGNIPLIFRMCGFSCALRFLLWPHNLLC